MNEHILGENDDDTDDTEEEEELRSPRSNPPDSNNVVTSLLTRKRPSAGTADVLPQRQSITPIQGSLAISTSLTKVPHEQQAGYSFALRYHRGQGRDSAYITLHTAQNPRCLNTAADPTPVKPVDVLRVDACPSPNSHSDRYTRRCL